MEENKIQCKFCCEYIPPDSKKCPFCNEDVEHSDTDNINNNNITTKRKKKKKLKKKLKIWFLRNEIIIFVLIFVLCFVGFVFGLNTYLHKFNLDSSLLDKLFDDKQNSASSELYENKKSDVDIEQAKTLYKQQRYDEAAMIFDNAAKNDNNPEAYYYLGKIYQARNYTKLAIKNFKEAERYNKDHIEAKFELANLYLGENDYDLAKQYALEVSDFQPNNLETLELLYTIYDNIGDVDNLKDVCQRIIKINKDHYDANYFLANYYLNNNDKRAINYCENILKSNYDREIAYRLVDLYSDMEHYTKAIETLDTIIKNEPSEINNVNYLKENIEFLREQYKWNHSMKEQETSQSVPASNPNPNPSGQASTAPKPPAAGPVTAPPYKSENSIPTPSFSAPEHITNNQTSNINEVDFAPYMKTLQRIIKMNWDPPKGNESKRVVVGFSINKDGSLVFNSIRVTTSSGIPEADAAAVNAVKLTSPFPPLPADFNGEKVDILFTFDYNVLVKSSYY